MKAAVNRSYWWPEVIRIMDIATPIPKDNQVLVKIYESTVNRSDEGVLKGSPYLFRLILWLTKPKRVVWGSDFVGEIVQVWTNVIKFQIWDIIFGFDDIWLQSHAEFLTISEDGYIAMVPLWVQSRDAVASIEWFHYAVQDLKSAPVTPGMEILVNGASGAIGSSLVQLYTIWWGIVTGIAHKENESKILDLGAKHFIDYTSENVLDYDKEYDIILDTVWNISFLHAKKIMKLWWVYLSSELWPWRENIRYSIITKFFGKKKCKFAIPTDIKSSIRYLSELLEQKKYKPLIDENVYGLDDIKSAYTYVTSGYKTWSVILTR